MLLELYSLILFALSLKVAIRDVIGLPGTKTESNMNLPAFVEITLVIVYAIFRIYLPALLNKASKSGSHVLPRSNEFSIYSCTVSFDGS